MQYVTIPGAPNGLLVNDIDTENSEHEGLWKVSYVFNETPYVVTCLEFARRTDAERAKVAIESIVDWTLPPKQVAAQLRKNGWTSQTVRQRMVEAMQW